MNEFDARAITFSRARLKILFLTWNYPPVRGGIEDMVWHLHAGLRARGHQVRVVTRRHPTADESPDVERVSRRGLAAFEIEAMRRGLRWVRRQGADVILCGSIAAAPAGWVVSRVSGVRYVVPAYGSELALRGWVQSRVTRWFFRRAARVLPISRATAERLEQAGVPSHHCTIIPPGVDVEKFEEYLASSRRKDRWPGREVLLTVGRLVRRKGVLEFVENALPRLVRRRPSILLAVVGDDARHSLVHAREGMRARIEEAAGRLGLQNHVVLLGAVPDDELAELYQRADLFVLPALDLPNDVEGFGIVFLEAALAAVPAVSTRVGGIPDAVEDGVTGVLVKGGDWPALADRIAELLEDRDRLARLGRAAAERARRQFAWPVIVERYERVLLETAQAIGRG